MTRRLLLMSALAGLVLTFLPAVASATFIPGPNGKVTFTTGRPSTGVPGPNAGDPGARIYVVDFPSGTPVQVTTLPEAADVRHRQPSWSPDHTRIAYAAGKTTYALWIKDLRTGSQTEFVPAAEGLDRPSWSPDGTKIAYGSQGDLWVKEVAPGSTAVNLTETAGVIEERPVWSPDGNTLYYNRKVGAAAKNLYKWSPVTPDGEATLVHDPEKEAWQPALSPDGNTLCFTLGPMNSETQVWLVGVNGGLATPFSQTTGGNINCAWSPDGSRIIYTQGVFTMGDLASRQTFDGKFVSLPESWSAPEHFDGNADWATNFPPECDEVSTAVDVNQFTTIQLSCTDPDFGTGASPPTPTAVDPGGLEIVSPPANGAVGGISDQGTVIYTPNKDFKGTDTFTYTGEADGSEATPATVTIQVGQEDGASRDTRAPVVSGIRVSPRRWRLGNQLARISLSPIGTTISFRLSEASQTTVAFQRQKPGRRVGRRCVKRTAANRKRRACKRFAGAGRVTKQGKAGRNRLRFQGLITRTRKLPLGTYRVVISARDAAGNRSKPRTGPTFTIVRK